MPRNLWLRVGYRPWGRLLHHFNLHHTVARPLPDGRTLHRCEWCGARRVNTPDWLLCQLIALERGYH